MRIEQKSNARSGHSIERLKIERLKNIRDFEFDLKGPRITGILGVNGIGKSTILHALACVYRPYESASVEYNRLSDFFKTNPHANWQGSRFEVDIRSTEFHSNKAPEDITKTIRYYKDSQKWSPKYVNRPRNESLFIGLEGIQTAGEDPTGYLYRNYATFEDANESADSIKQDLTYILGREYSKINTHIVSKGNNRYEIDGLEWNDVTYSELSMGSGEKRVVKLLRSIHHARFKEGGLILIDELDILLHDLSFRRLLDVLIRKCESGRYNRRPLQIVFSTHRESVAKFIDKINICSLHQTPLKTFSFSYVSPNVIRSLTGDCVKPLEIFVEDELAEEIVTRLVEKREMAEFVEIEKFGSIDNAYTIIASKLLHGTDTSNTICVLDGDVKNSQANREKQIKIVLNGDDKEGLRAIGLKSIRNFELLIQSSARPDDKAPPEYNHKKMFESLSFSPDEKIYQIQCCSREIIDLPDWHLYYPELARRTNCKRVRDYVLEALENSHYWPQYVRQISDWLDEKRVELRLESPKLTPEMLVVQREI